MKAFLRWLKLFFVGDPSPPTEAPIARSGVDCDGYALRHTGLSQIMHASQETTNVVYFGERKRQLLAKSLIEECGQLTGPAFSFERKEK